MAETVLVTGGAGFVAGWCIVKLLEQGYAVRATVRSASREAGVRAAVARAGHGDQLSFAHVDLTKDDGWDAAMAGVDYVLHVASPLGGSGLTKREDYVAAAQGGTLRVLKAAVKAGVKRVVMTSAAATARAADAGDKVSDETTWADPTKGEFDDYRYSKVLAERAAWDFMNANGGKTEFTTVLPGAVYGPVLSKENMSSVATIERMLNGQPPTLARLSFSVVDVRDLADLHLKAMIAPEAAGERFIGVGEALWMKEIADILRTRFGAQASKVPTIVAPDAAVRLATMNNPLLKMLMKDLGKRNLMSSEKARRVLGFSPRPAAETIIECAESLLAA